MFILLTYDLSIVELTLYIKEKYLNDKKPAQYPFLDKKTIKTDILHEDNSLYVASVFGKNIPKKNVQKTLPKKMEHNCVPEKYTQNTARKKPTKIIIIILKIINLGFWML